jgi:hypothetical protein
MTDKAVITKRIFRKYGLLYFRADMPKGTSIDVKSHLEHVSIKEYCAIIAHGAIDIYHADKDPAHRTWLAAKSMIAQGLALPGEYLLTAVEDSVYVCCSPFFTNGPWMRVDMYKVDHIHLDVDQEHVFNQTNRIEAVVVLDGNVEINGVEGNYGPGDLIEVKGLTKIKALVPAHLTIVIIK